MSVDLKDVALADIVRVVREVVAERPDHSYARVKDKPCSYIRSADDSEEGCVIGIALARLGVDRDYLRRCDVGQRDSFEFGGTIGSVLIGLGMVNAKERSIECDRYRWLSVVQANQDNGARWSLCVMRADEGYPNV